MSWVGAGCMSWLLELTERTRPLLGVRGRGGATTSERARRARVDPNSLPPTTLERTVSISHSLGELSLVDPDQRPARQSRPRPCCAPSPRLITCPLDLAKPAQQDASRTRSQHQRGRVPPPLPPQGHPPRRTRNVRPAPCPPHVRRRPRLGRVQVGRHQVRPLSPSFCVSRPE